MSKTAALRSRGRTETTLADPEVGECIARAAEGWRFPKARDGGIARVTYPFVLWSR